MKNIGKKVLQLLHIIGTVKTNCDIKTQKHYSILYILLNIVLGELKGRKNKKALHLGPKKPCLGVFGSKFE